MDRERRQTVGGVDASMREKVSKIPGMRLDRRATAKSSKECGICWSYYSSPIFLILRMKQVMHNLLEIV
jgi:hypothetical protein